MKKSKKILGLTGLALAAALTMTGCSEGQERKELQKSTTLTHSLELDNLKKKRDKENDPNVIRYLYVMSFGEIVGYYVTKGKISSSASQMAPEQEIIGHNGNPAVVDSSKDDGSYGQGDPGIFFFTTDGVMVETNLDYIQSDEPIAIDVPRLGGKG